MAKTKKVASSKSVITELSLMSIETSRLQIARLRADLRKAEASLDQQESTVMKLLKEGAEVEGDMLAMVTTELGSCRPKWQELHLLHMASHGMTAEAVLEAARAKYPAKESEVLVISVKNLAV